MGKPLALIVEDNEGLATTFAEAAQEAGYSTEIVRSGDGALNRLAVLVPDLVILDLHLPRVQGTEVLAHIRKDPRLSSTQVIVSTAHSGEAAMLEEKADLVLLKPIAFDQLRDLAARLQRGIPPAEAL
ncbi:MAG: response regulator [Anaerolineae bacterium]|nr:response regulator [Anaerolineae bacterium]